MKFAIAALVATAATAVPVATERDAILAQVDASGCQDDYIWENCSELYYRYSCAGDDHYGEDGWYYLDDEFYEDWWVTRAVFESWDYC